MTREEAIKQLDTMWKMLTSAYDEIADSFVVAYTMAVDVLKAQMVKSDDLKVESAQNVQNGDLISRNLAIDELYKMLHDYFWTDDEELDAIIATLNDLPSAQPNLQPTCNELATDCISRQDAIDHWRLIIDATSTDSRYNMGFVDGLEFCISHLSTMPSAQPEEDCDTCKHGYFGNDQCNNCRVRYPSHYERRTDEGSD